MQAGFSGSTRARPALHAARARTEAHLLCQLAQPLLYAHTRLPLEQLQVLLNLQDDLQSRASRCERRNAPALLSAPAATWGRALT